MSLAPRALAIASLSLVALSVVSPVSAEDRIVPTSPTQLTLSYAPVVRRVAPAVVNVYAAKTVSNRNPLFEDPLFRRFFGGSDGPQVQRSLGSGVIVDPSGLVVTNHHVIEGADEVKVSLADKREIAAEVVLRDARSDLAVLRLKDSERFPAIELGDSDALQVGDVVLALGNPFAVGQTVTHGIVSAVARTQVGITDYQFFIQTDAAINPGNSGGALVNLRGELIGINSAILSGGGGNIGIGFAIPSNMAKSVVDQLIKFGSVKRGILGVNVVTLTPDYADNLGLKDQQGALVSQVVQGSAADQAGIKAGDVITTVNGQTVKTGAELRNRIGLLRIGESVEIGLLHEGKARHVSATVQARTETDVTTGSELHRALEGAELADTPGGVVVRSVGPGTPANQLGLHPQDQIAQVNRDRVRNLQELKAAMKDQSSLILTVRRGNAVILIPLR
jgi:Do/DeqQ family serine protease